MSNEYIKLDELAIPKDALNDSNAVEMLRVWRAENKLHCSLKVGMYREKSKIPEEKAWGTIIADIAKQISKRMEEAGTSKNKDEALKKIQKYFVEELQEPTTYAKGEFIKKH